MKVRILLADDHKMFRHALKLALEKEAHLEVIGEASDGQELLKLAHETKPDVVCVDISMPILDGIKATRILHASSPKLKIIGLTTFSDQYHVSELMAAGAAAYVTKTEAINEIARAITMVYKSNKRYFCPDIAANIVDEFACKDSAQKNISNELSRRERQVLHMVADGHTSVDIAQHLNLAITTVEVHRRNIMRKLNLHNIAELTKFAIRNGITSI